MFAQSDTWNKEAGCHSCCDSRHTYHKSTCHLRREKAPGRTTDPDFMNVQDCKAEGLSSNQCASRLNMPLEQVNDLWVL